MKKVKFFFLSLMTMVMCGMTTSCNPADIVEEIMDYNEYFIALDNVESNLADASGNSLSQALYDEFKFDQSGTKSQSLGKLKSDDVAKETFQKSCSVIEEAYKAAYNGVLPQGGYIKYNMSLRVHSADGGKLDWKTITIQ